MLQSTTIKKGSIIERISSNGVPYRNTIRWVKGPFISNGGEERIEFTTEEYQFKVNYKLSDIKVITNN